MLEKFTWYKQSGYRWRGDGLTIYIDPWHVPEDAGPADAIFITHAHFDHYSKDDIAQLQAAGTRFVAPADVAAELSGDVTPVGPGESGEAAGVKFETTPAYNVVEGRLDFHPKSNNWVGYILTLDGTTYYHAGDTDHVPELDGVRANVAFVPIGGFYCMGVDEAVGLVKAIQPDLAVPMHYGFVEGVGHPSHADEFAEKAAPVKVEILSPLHEFGA